MQKIPYVNLAQQWAEERDEILPLLEEVLASGMYVGGTNVLKFESDIEERLGVSHCVSLNSGTDALVCSLMALGVRARDEVITPPNSFIASTAAICHIGAIPIFADVLPDQTIDPQKVEEAVTDRTKAIMPVHLTGRMARMDEIASVAKKYNLVVVEDAAQSIGSRYKEHESGTCGDAGCFSAHPLKNLNACGDSGFVVTENSEVADRIRSMRNHGLMDRDTVESFGYVSRMDEIQAAILAYRLTNLEEVVSKRRKNAHLYKEILNDNFVFTPFEDERYFDTFHTFVVQVQRRDELRLFLNEQGIQTAIHYPIPIHLQPAAKSMGLKTGRFPVTERQSKQILTLPVNQTLNPSHIEYVAQSVNNFFENTK